MTDIATPKHSPTLRLEFRYTDYDGDMYVLTDGRAEYMCVVYNPATSEIDKVITWEGVEREAHTLNVEPIHGYDVQ